MRASIICVVDCQATPNHFFSIASQATHTDKRMDSAIETIKIYTLNDN